MERLTTTPFGQRPMNCTLIEHAEQANAPASVPHLNKWELFRTLCTARLAFNVTDRDLTVLNALLSFHREANLSDNDRLIVFPSNASLSERAHGMAESTLRRHLAALVKAGLIHRHDSPNGKRYAARGAGGEITRAFGFDLRPLLVRAREINLAASEVRADAERLKRTREDVSLMKRDALKLVLYGHENSSGACWKVFEAELLCIHKQMRRNLSMETLAELRIELKTLLTRVQKILIKTENMSGSDAVIERHYPNSNKDSYESELCKDQSKGGEEEVSILTEQPSGKDSAQVVPNIPLGLVLKACPDIEPYSKHELRHWHELVATAAFVRGMMGISQDAWDQAQRAMGREVAAMTVAAILQRISEIKSPGGYLRALTRKAETGGFSAGPMVMALLRSDKKAA